MCESSFDAKCTRGYTTKLALLQKKAGAITEYDTWVSPDGMSNTLDSFDSSILIKCLVIMDSFFIYY